MCYYLTYDLAICPYCRNSIQKCHQYLAAFKEHIIFFLANKDFFSVM